MEEPKNLIFNNNNKFKKEKPQMSFSEYFYNGIDIMPVINESLEKMRKFVIFVIEQLNKAGEKKEDKQTIFMTEKIFDLMISKFDKFGMPFFYELFSEEKFKNILMNLILDGLYFQQIKQLMAKIIYLFNFDFDQREMEHPFESLYNDIIPFGIINKEEYEDEEKRDSFSDEEILFLDSEYLQRNWKNYRHADEENDAKDFLESILSGCEEQLVKLMGEEKIPKSSIEYYHEKVNYIKNYKNKPKQKKEIKKNEKGEINEINMKFYYSSEEEEIKEEEVEEEIKTPEQIKQDIIEQRKKPLKDRTYFYKNEYIIYDENEYIEYKNYYFPLHINQEKELQRQFCAFLNTNGGRIYLGINDVEKMVKGVLIQNPIKYYEEKVFRLINQIKPTSDPKKYFKFYAIPIKDNNNGKIRNNLFIFKIVIKKGDPTKLYYVFGQGLNISTRQAGQCPNLKASEIYEKIILKKNMKEEELNENQIDENNKIDFDDPEPLYNQKIKNNELYKINKKQRKKNIKIYNPINKNNFYNYKNNNNINQEKNINNNNIIENNNNKENMNIDFDNNDINENEFNNFKNEKKKKNKKKKNKKGNRQIIVEVSNLDPKADDKYLMAFFEPFNHKSIKFFKNQNGEKFCNLIFNDEKEADNFINIFNGSNQGGDRNIKTKKVYS